MATGRLQRKPPRDIASVDDDEKKSRLRLPMTTRLDREMAGPLDTRRLKAEIAEWANATVEGHRVVLAFSYDKSTGLMRFYCRSCKGDCRWHGNAHWATDRTTRLVIQSTDHDEHGTFNKKCKVRGLTKETTQIIKEHLLSHGKVRLQQVMQAPVRVCARFIVVGFPASPRPVLPHSRGRDCRTSCPPWRHRKSK